VPLLFLFIFPHEKEETMHLLINNNGTLLTAELDWNEEELTFFWRSYHHSLPLERQMPFQKGKIKPLPKNSQDRFNYKLTILGFEQSYLMIHDRTLFSWQQEEFFQTRDFAELGL